MELNNGDPEARQWRATAASVFLLHYPLLSSPALSAFRPCLQPHPPASSPATSKIRGDPMAHQRNPRLLGGDQLPADAGDEALVMELPNEADLSWPEREWLSALGVPLEDTPPTEPAAAELDVHVTGEMYYMLPGEPEELDDTPAEQLLEFLMMPVPDEQDSVADTAGPRDGKGNGDAISPLLGELQE